MFLSLYASDKVLVYISDGVCVIAGSNASITDRGKCSPAYWSGRDLFLLSLGVLWVDLCASTSCQADLEG